MQTCLAGKGGQVRKASQAATERGFGKSQIAVKVRKAGKARKVRKSNLPRKDRETGKDTKLTGEASMHWPRSHWPLGAVLQPRGAGVIFAVKKESQARP
jgi:hypothetical protein